MIKRIMSALMVCLLLSGYADATTISRLKSAEISNGNVINADDLETEFDQLVNESNSKETRINSLESGTMSISGNKTLSGATTLSGSTIMSNEVSITGELNLGRGTDIASPANGDLWYNTVGNQLKARINGATVSLGITPPSGYISGNKPVYATANTITLATGMTVTDDTGVVSIVTTTTETCALNTSGAGGLDTGSEASNTWYYPWLIRKSSDGAVDCLFSTSRTAPTMPSGYDQKRRLPLAVRNDASSNITPFLIGQGWPYSPFIEYNVHIGDQLAVGSNNVLNTGAATSFTAVDLSALVPPISTMAYMKGTHLYTGAVGTLRLRATGESHNGLSMSASNTSAARQDGFFHLPTNTSQSIDYMNTAASTQNWLWVVGFTVNE